MAPARRARARVSVKFIETSANIIRACQMRMQRVKHRVNLLLAGSAARSHVLMCVHAFTKLGGRIVFDR